MDKLNSRKWIVAQIGAREHYTAPIGLHRLGLLHSFYTDLWVGRSSATVLRSMGKGARSLAGRYHPEVPNDKVVAFNVANLMDSLFSKNPSSMEDRYEGYIRKGKAFANVVCRHLLPRRSKIGAFIYFAFTTGALETVQALRKEGVPTVVDQIDPARVEDEIVREEIARWPGWQTLPGRIPESYFQRLEEEWAMADVVLVNSRWCQEALRRQGVPISKIAVAPIPYEESGNARLARPKRARSSSTDPLRVLWLGQVNLRKGIQYLIEAARCLKGKNVEFRVIGPIQISTEAVATAPENLVFVGSVPRIEVQEAYSWADVFVLPTLSDGFALTQLEAMAAGLPVITTPNCGEVVHHGEDGFIVPIRDSQTLAELLEQLEQDRERVCAMSEQAIRTVERFRVNNVTDQRLSAIQEKMGRN